jgi:hypothetical protein
VQNLTYRSSWSGWTSDQVSATPVTKNINHIEQLLLKCERMQKYSVVSKFMVLFQNFL